MRTRRPFLLVVLLSIGSLSLPQGLHAQLLTQGGAGSIFQQFDNSSGNPQSWTRSLGVGYFNTGNPGPTTPLSFLHVYNEFVPLPANGSIADHSETFRTQVGAGQDQNWRMVRGQLEIGRLYHSNPNNSFRIRVVQPATAAQAAAHLFLENSNGDGVRISANTVGAVPQPVNGFLLERRGYVALGSAAGWSALSPAGPWSRLHLSHENQGASAPNFAYRPWMRNGTMGTGNSDLFYVGHKYAMVSGTGAEVDDLTDLVAAWGDDVLPAGSAHGHDNFSFRFVGALGQGGSAGTVEGLELLRLRPFRNTTQDPIVGFVGVGDWVNAGGAVPEERLDILNGKLRIRSLPTDPAGSTLDKYMVVDNTGVVHWRTLPAGVTACEWTLQGPPGSNSHIATAYAGNPGCPQADRQVGIGTNAPDSKLHVVADQSGTVSRAGRFIAENGSDLNTALSCIAAATGAHESRGVYAQAIDGELNSFGVNSESLVAQGATLNSYGVHTKSRVLSGGNVTNSYGVDAWSELGVGTAGTNSFGMRSRSWVKSGASVENSFGLDARSSAESGSAVEHTVGVRGQASLGTRENYGGRFYATEAAGGDNYGIRAAGNSSAGTNWAGWFDGDVWITGRGWVQSGIAITSDAQLKTNIQPVSGGLSKVRQLAPVTYDFTPQAVQSMGFEAVPQVGLIAQEVELVVPEAVRQIVYPAQYDSSGVQTSGPLPLKGIDYTKIVPLLIAAIQEQDQRMAQLEQQLAQCCAATSPVDGRGMQPMGTPDGGPGDQRLRIQPNLFGASTTVVYTLERAAQVRLEVADEQGRLVRVLRQGAEPAGEQRVEWPTGQLAPGTYLVRLVVDGTPQVERAVKW